MCLCVTTSKAFLIGNEGELIPVCGGCRVLSCTTVRLCPPWSIILETVIELKPDKTHHAPMIDRDTSP